MSQRLLRTILAMTGTLGFSTRVLATDAAAGNCCADLGDRIEQLEATAARTGGKKVSLTVSGFVNQSLLYWDDGGERNLYQVDGASPTRFRFVGKAKISTEVSAGFLLEIGAYAVRPDQVSRDSDENSAATIASGGAPIQLRHSAWWIEHRALGKLWLGQTSDSTDFITEINLSNTGHFAGPSTSSLGIVGFTPLIAATGAKNPFGTALNFLGGDALQNVGEGQRFNVIKYDSPTIAGFTASASVGEDDLWAVALRYAGEFNGIKVAGGVGYRANTDANGVTAPALISGCSAGVAAPGASGDTNCRQIGLSASMMHVASGLYVSGAYGLRKDGNRKNFAGADAKDTDEMWWLQGGIERKYSDLGKTTVFGEYLVDDMGHQTNIATKGFAEASGKMWGLGINQSLEAAVMDLYFAYRAYSFDAYASSATGSKAGKAAEMHDISTFLAGAIIRF